MLSDVSYSCPSATYIDVGHGRNVAKCKIDVQRARHIALMDHYDTLGPPLEVPVAWGAGWAVQAVRHTCVNPAPDWFLSSPPVSARP